jgi:hypothetical protein
VGRIVLLAISLVGIGCDASSGGTDSDAGDDDGTEEDGGGIFAVSSTIAEDGATEVNPVAPIVVAFTRPVRADSISAETFTVTGSSGEVTGSFTVEQTTVTFTPDAPLYLLDTFDVALTTGISSADDAGSLPAAYEFSFQVRDGDWSGRIDLADGVASIIDIASNRRGDMLLAYITPNTPSSIEAVSYDAMQRSFSAPEPVEQEEQPFTGARAAINEGGDALVAWSTGSDPPGRGWARRSAGAWDAAVLGPGAVGAVGLTADGTAVMASSGAGPDTVVETLPPGASVWTAPATAVENAILSGVLQSGDRIEIIAFEQGQAQLVARGYTPGAGLSEIQPLSSEGVTAASIHLQHLPGRDLAVSWQEGASEIRYAQFDGAARTWSSATLASGALGSAICANASGARLAAYISGDELFGAHADPGEEFDPPENLGSTAGLEAMETAGCALDNLDNGHLFWARASGRSLRSRFASGQFGEARHLGNGPSMRGAVGAPDSGGARVVFFTGNGLTARSFQ